MIDPRDLSRDEMLAKMEAAKDAVAAFTGMRQQFVDAGWTPVNAEGMVIAILRAQSGGAA